jgi:chromosome segregation ATPase
MPDLATFFTDQLTLLFSVSLFLSVDVADMVQKRDTFSSQLQKLQRECREMQGAVKEAGKEAQRAREDKEVVVRENIQVKAQLQELVDERVEAKVKAEEQRERYEAMTVEVERCRERMRTLEEERDRAMKEAEGMRTVKEEVKREREERQKVEKERQWVEVQIKAKETEVEE